MLCTYAGCGRQSLVKGMCQKHYQKKYEKENPDYVEKKKAATRAWYRRNPSKTSAHRMSPKARFANFRKCAQNRKLEVTVSFDEFCSLIILPCFYCGGSLPPQGSGIDRINSDTGYVNGNVRPCCGSCNTAKNTMTENQFKEWVLKVFNYWVSH